MVFLLFCMMITGMPVAHAQVPGALVPGRQVEQFTPPAPKSVPGPARTQMQAQPKPAGSEKIMFVLKGIQLKGVTVFSEQELNKIWAPYVGQKISVAKLYDFASQITQKYANAGYALSFAFLPEQQIDNNAVVIQVVEGYVSSVHFVGDAVRNGHPRAPMIERMAQKITQSKPLKTADLERYLLLMNDLPGTIAQATFSPSKTMINGSDMQIDVSYKPVALEATIDNELAPLLDRWNMGAGATVNGVFTGSDALHVKQTCGLKCDIFNYMTLGWSTYVGTEGLKLSIDATKTTETAQEGLLKALDFNGKDESVQLQASYPILRSRQQSMNVVGSFDYANSQTKIFAGTFTRDRVRTVGLAANYDFADRTAATNFAQLGLKQGLPYFDATDKDDPLRSRAFGSSEYTNLEFYASREQPLAIIMPSLSNFSLFASTRMQKALNHSLLSSNQCYYGGSDMGRGYDNGAIGGDDCVMGNIELRRNFQYNDFGMQAFGFGDAGLVHRQKDSLLLGEVATQGAQSVGAGLRVGFRSNVKGELTMAWPLRDQYTSDGKGAPKTLLALTVQY